MSAECPGCPACEDFPVIIVIAVQQFATEFATKEQARRELVHKADIEFAKRFLAQAIDFEQRCRDDAADIVRRLKRKECE